MYTIDLYETSDGRSDIRDFLEELRKKSSASKDARIQYQQFARFIWLLRENGTHLPQEITKHPVDDIWELRPGSNRVFYFFYRDNTFVLLHHFKRNLRKHRGKKWIVPYLRNTTICQERGKRRAVISAYSMTAGMG